MLVTGEAVTANYFDVLGAQPAIGRGFRDEENASPGAAPVAVLSYGLWQRRFAGRPAIVGETIKLSGSSYTIIGVGPRGFTGTIPGIPTEFWVPVVMVDRLEFSGVQTQKDTANSQTERHPPRASRHIDGCSSRAGSPKADRSKKCARRPTRSLRGWPHSTRPRTKA